MAVIMLAVLALGTAACNTLYTQKSDDAAEAFSALPEDVIEEHPVVPVDAVSGPDGGSSQESDPSDELIDQFEFLPEDVITDSGAPARENGQDNRYKDSAFILSEDEVIGEVVEYAFFLRDVKFTDAKELSNVGLRTGIRAI